MMQTQSPGLCALASATVVTRLLYATVVSPDAGRVPDEMTWKQDSAPANVEGICKWARQQRLFGICEMNEILPSLFLIFPSHICVTRLVKSLSLKLPRSMGHRSEKPSNMRKSEREREGEKVREIGPGMIANCLSNGCHPGSHFRWLVIRHERGRPARIPLLTLSSQWATVPNSFRLSLVTSPLTTPLSPILDAFSLLFFSLCCFLHVSHFASSSLQCVSLALAQQLLFSDRSVKQKMMPGIKNRSWSKAQPPYSHYLLFCISSKVFRDSLRGNHLLLRGTVSFRPQWWSHLWKDHKWQRNHLPSNMLDSHWLVIRQWETFNF